jgi:hypothetical protein
MTRGESQRRGKFKALILKDMKSQKDTTAEGKALKEIVGTPSKFTSTMSVSSARQLYCCPYQMLFEAFASVVRVDNRLAIASQRPIDSCQLNREYAMIQSTDVPARVLIFR